MKTTMSKIKIIPDWINGRFDITEESISELEGIGIDTAK